MKSNKKKQIIAKTKWKKEMNTYSNWKRKRVPTKNK